MDFREYDLAEDYAEYPRRPQMRFGVDIGQVIDHTAIAACRVEFVNRGNTFMRWVRRRLYTMTGAKTIDREIEVPKLEPKYSFRNFKRIDLGTSYEDVADIVARLACDPSLVTYDVKVAIDITGNRAIWPMIQNAFDRRRRGSSVMLTPVTFRAGDDYDESKGTLGKGYLVGRLKLLSQQRMIKFPAGAPEAAELQRQLQSFDETVTASGHAQYGAAPGFHDDLIVACGLCCVEHAIDDGEDDIEAIRQIAQYPYTGGGTFS